MATDLEEQKKVILPFMQRAQEIQQADPKVAYYCRLYAVEQALKIPQRAKEINSLVAAALGSLEKEKARLDLDPAADRIHCLGFALRIFDNADRVDRAGKATERTSKAYYAASVFIEILNHWEGAVDNELLEKQRYCAWRAAEIRKALREGRQPLPPPSAEEGALPPAGGAGPGGLDDLPPASGSSDWAYSGSSRTQQPPPPPPPPPGSEGGGGSFSAGSAYGGSFSSGSQFPTAPPPPPQPAQAAPAAPEARFWPGAKVLVRTEEGLEGGAGESSDEPVVGTVGQVIRRPDGGFSYKVALTDRLVELPDEAAVPALEEGGMASLPTRYLPPGLAAPGLAALPTVPVRVLLINSASWPPSFLVQTPAGKEIAVAASQLAPPPRREGAAAAAPPPPPPPQPLPQGSSAADMALGPDYGSAPAHPHPPAPLGAGAAAAYPHPYMAPSAPPPPSYPSMSQAYTGAPPHAPPPPQPPVPPPQYNKSYSTPGAPPAAAAAPAPISIPTLPPGFKPSLQAITEAQKQAKYAISALSFEDVPTAVKNLSEALRMLTSPGAVPGRR